MAITIEVMTEDITLATEWASLRITEQIGAPDSMTVDSIGFTTNALFTQSVVDVFANPGDYFSTVVRLGSDIIFSGLGRRLKKSKTYPGEVRYGLTAAGWQHLMSKRLVGTPYTWSIPADPVDGLPTPILVDPRAIASPTAGGVQALFGYYWPFPDIDVTNFVTDIAPPESTLEQLTWSGSDLEGAINDLAAAGSAAALWYFANDSPDAQSVYAPNLAFHFGVVTMPDEGEDIDDLLLGLPSADLPTNLAPYNLSDTPNWTTEVMPESLEFDIEQTRIDGVFVRGATGSQLELQLNPNFGAGYTVVAEHEGGTGWIGVPDITGEEYLDAPAAISFEQRLAIGGAYLASRYFPVWTGTAVVRGAGPGGNFDGWHKGQAIQVTDADYGFDGRWFLIRAVSLTMTDPAADDIEYTLTLGDVLAPSLGYSLRKQRLDEQRKPVDPAVHFVAYDGNLLPAAGETSPETFQLASASGDERPVAGVGAQWSLIVNGLVLVDPTDTGELFYLSDETTVTDDRGQVTAILHASASATGADDANVYVDVVLP